MAFVVRDYKTGDLVPGKASKALVDSSFNEAAPDDVGAVFAYSNEGTWFPLSAEQTARFKARGILVHLVYVEES